ncbi:MAG TPA: hypothetical protein VFQ61_06260, partial [Polyangiaceae bacterium]|nr:hypothetical protein [Polyangiaceae bacterium]
MNAAVQALLYRPASMMRLSNALAGAAATMSLACGGPQEPSRALAPRERAPCLSLPERCAGESGVFPVSGYSPRLPAHELAPIAATLADADVVGLGEAAHGSAGFIGIKVRLSRELIEHYGFRVIAWE